jgi:subtilisin family serine protease
MKKTIYNLALLSVIVLASCTKELNEMQMPETSSSVPGSAISEAASTDKFVPNELLVKFKPGISANAQSNALARINGKASEKVLTKAMQKAGDNEGFYIVHTPLAVLEAISKMKGVEIEYAEPNYIYQHIATSNDPYFTNGSLWGMNTGNGSNAVTAWSNNHTGSANVVIGIIDEGAMYNHTDLSGNIKNPLEFGGTAGFDDDGNGYVDDIYGWDFDGNNNSTFDGVDDDHGTHVAGTIGAKGGNGIGVAGVSWNVTMISAKFLGKRGGTTANAVKAVDYFTDIKPALTAKGYNLVATNNSWGGGGSSQALLAAITRANAKDILFIAAAGNNGTNNDASASYPSNYNVANVIAVASITSSGGLSSFSNYGATTVDLGAPGSGIYSTLPVRSGKTVGSGYGSYSGTSMATPHVTGAAALYASSHPGATAATIKSAIMDNVVSTPSLIGKTVTGGRLNVSGF